MILFISAIACSSNDDSFENELEPAVIVESIKQNKVEKSIDYYKFSISINVVCYDYSVDEWGIVIGMDDNKTIQTLTNKDTYTSSIDFNTIIEIPRSEMDETKQKVVPLHDFYVIPMVRFGNKRYYDDKKKVNIELMCLQGCPDDHHPHALDLGLPSGTKWACCNLGASKPEEYGGYYAWGEISEKTSYGIENYAYYDTSSSSYINIGADISGLTCDVAHVKWGNSWCMPTVEQMRELYKYSSQKYATINGVRGIKLTGLNNNFTTSDGISIFLPAAGIKIGTGTSGAGEYGEPEGDYLSSTIDNDNGEKVYQLYFSYPKYETSYCSLKIISFNRELGYSIRPVSNN